VEGLRVSRPGDRRLRAPMPETAGGRGSGATFVSAGQSDFSRYYAPLVPRFARWRWVLHAEPHVFRFPDDWYRDYDEEKDAFGSPELLAAEGLVREQRDDWRLVEGMYLARVAGTLLDDWADFYALADPATGLDAFLEGYWAAETPEAAHAFLARATVLHFSCVDGAVWEVHAADPALLAEVRAHLGGVPGAAAADSTLMASLRRYDAGG
jgi:hypothetical protein